MSFTPFSDTLYISGQSRDKKFKKLKILPASEREHNNGCRIPCQAEDGRQRIHHYEKYLQGRIYSLQTGVIVVLQALIQEAQKLGAVAMPARRQDVQKVFHARPLNLPLTGPGVISVLIVHFHDAAQIFLSAHFQAWT